MSKRHGLISIILSLFLLMLPVVSFAQTMGRFGIIKDNFSVDIGGGETVDVQVEAKCVEGGVSEPPFVVELVALYTNNTTQVVDVTSSINVTNFSTSDTANDVSIGGNGNSQLISNSDDFVDIQINTEVFDEAGSTSLGSSDSGTFSAQCSPTAVSLNSTLATTGAGNWVMVVAFLLLALATAVIWQRRQQA